MGAMKNCLLTEEEKELISLVACDIASGNHLLYPRSEEYWSFGKMVNEALTTETPDEKQKEIKEYFHQCTDYFYWKNLPDEDKMF